MNPESSKTLRIRNIFIVTFGPKVIIGNQRGRVFKNVKLGHETLAPQKAYPIETIFWSI
jgi:hypothetical protein